MASLQELLKYLEQFMHGNLNAQHTPHPPTPSSVPHAAMPSGGMPAGMPHPTGLPPGALPPGAEGALPPGAAGPGEMPPGMAGLPPELATASPEQMQQAVQMFGQLHPELASHLPTGDSPMDVQSVLNHLANIPPEALAGFTPSTGGTAEFGDLGGGLGGPLDGDFGDLTDLGDTFSDFAGLGDAGGTTADFGAVPAILNGGPELDISALQGFGVDLEGQYGDLPAMAEATDTGFSLDDLLGATSGLAEPEPVGADTFESFDSFDPSIAAFDDADTAYGADPLQPDDITAINEDQYNQ